ncbi:MAG: CBS domain-containing protein [Sterolibacterium sp.]|jgi:CBS domain-containing protein|nr:CBS domain-containing protein [Sterolibacterium sp.]
MTQRMLREIVADQKPLVASPEMTVRDAVQWMLRECCGAILVERSGRLIGIFTEHDALSRVLGEGRQAGQTLLHEVMTRTPVTLNADHRLVDALDLMRQFGFRHVPVVDGDRSLGVVSLRDILESDYRAAMVASR